MKTLFVLLLFLLQSSLSYACGESATWVVPGKATISEEDVFTALNNPANYLLIGEHHANEAHHRWHLGLLTKLFKLNPNIALGIEAFPRSKQPILDQWIAGTMSEQDFIRNIDWENIWGFDLNLYMPLFRWAREQRAPLVALNVELSLIQRIKKDGVSPLSESEREFVSLPEKPNRDYVAQLARSFREHGTQYASKQEEQIAFLRFVEQQLFWDRAMAEALRDAKRKYADKWIIGIVGSWHLIGKQGIPFQIASLHESQVTTIVPWDDHLDCNQLQKDFADFVYFPQ